MSLSIGIVGLPNVGKSTLFQAITKKQVNRANYPFCTIDPNIGVVAVSDERVDQLAKLTNSLKKIYTTIEFVDIAGLVKGASQGEGLGNKFLANIREVDAVVYILRCFGDDEIINVNSCIDVLKDKDVLDMEMALKDLEVVDKRIHGLEGEVKTQNKEAIKEFAILKKAREYLGQGKILADFDWELEEKKVLNNYQLLTIKPRMFLLNGKESEVSQEIIKTFQDNNWPFLILDVLTEFDSTAFDPEERKSFGLPDELKLDSLIKESYKTLNLITFLTTGPDETRAWTLKKGSTAPQAGGVIHSDFEANFIKAEIINWKDLLDAGGFSKARESGLIRTEGKEYVVQDGDVIEIKSNA
ncbi:MAG: redox-regulated ATPase YchF [Patescibacteria group bacterium]|nr:redox-regulated ATPase YchF [Patescibacteria group bacterium]MBU1876790.1 redox-regulated ATPase YchF [Patescibacteria group bacterium]